MPRPQSSPSNRSPRPAFGLAAAAVPLAALAAMAAFATAQTDPTAAAETAYLAILGGAVMLVVAALSAARPAAELWLGAPLLTLAVWALPTGPARGAVVTALLVALLVAAGTRRLAADTPGTGSLTASFASLVPFALGAQLLLRGERLLAPELGVATVVSLLALPTAAAAALAVLAERRGAAALIAGAAVVVLAPGFNVVATLALLALAAGAVLARPPRPQPAAGARAVAWAVPIGALAALAAPFLWDPRAAAVAVLAALVLSGRRAAIALAGVGGIAFAAAAPAAAWREAGTTLAWVPILLPTLPWAAAGLVAARRRAVAATEAPAAADLRPGTTPAGGRWLAASLVAGAVLTVAAAPAGPAALTAPVALFALLLSPALGRSAPAHPRSATAMVGGAVPVGLGAALLATQAVWSAALLAGTALFATYPWLRPRPATAALGLLDLAPGWWAALALTAAAVVPAAALAIARRSGTAVRPVRPTGLAARPTAWAGALLVAAVAIALPDAGVTVVTTDITVLDRFRPRLDVELSGRPVAAVIVESNLSNAVELPAGTRVATVSLVGGGRRLEWALAVARDTGEWAARRQDVAGQPELAVPPGWLSWVALDEGRQFFGQRYRSRLDGATSLAASRLEVVRNPDLPPKVALNLYRLETAR